MARSERFELPTPRFEVWCSIQLSYERTSRRPRYITKALTHPTLRQKNAGKQPSLSTDQPAPDPPPMLLASCWGRKGLLATWVRPRRCRKCRTPPGRDLRRRAVARDGASRAAIKSMQFCFDISHSKLPRPFVPCPGLSRVGFYANHSTT